MSSEAIFQPMLLTALAVVVGASVILAGLIFQGLVQRHAFGEPLLDEIH